MKFLPYDSFAIDSRLSQDAIAVKLAEHVDAKAGFWRHGDGDQPFRGEVSRDGFTIMRRIGYRNSFLPVIVGAFCPGPRGTRLSVVMRLHRLVLVFIIIWTAGVGFAALTGLRVALARGEFRTALIPMAMFAFAWVLTNGLFWYEAAKAKAILTQLFGSEVEGAPGPGQRA